MNIQIKKFVTVMLSGAMLFSASGVMLNQNVFAGELDKTIAVTAIRQLPSWCWIDSAYMMLIKYLKDNGKLLEGESIYERYGDECVIESPNYNGGHVKSKEEFEQLYSNIFIDKTVLGNSSIIADYEDSPIYKDQAFLVYLSTNLLNKNNYQEIFQSYYSDGASRPVNIVLKAVGLNNKICVDFEIYEDKVDLKFGVINYALNKNSSVVSFGGGHVKVINGIQDNKVSVQETGGEPASLVDANVYLQDQLELLFIGDVNIGRNGDRLEGIWSVDPNKNQDDVIYRRNEEISVFLDLNENVNKVYLINSNRNILFTKTLDYVIVSYGDNFKCLNKYVAKAIEDISLRDLINNYHFDENYRPEENKGSSSSSSGGSSGSWSSGNIYNKTADVKKTTLDVKNPTNNIVNLVTYEYNADSVNAISAKEAIKSYLPKDVDLTNVKDNKTIIFKTNKYDMNNNKENLAVWTFEIANLNKDFVGAYTQLQNYEEKTGTLNEEEKGKLQELNKKIAGYNFKLNVKNTSVEDSAVPDKIKEMFKGKNSILVDFSEGGNFPGEATVDVNFGKDKANQEYIVYYLNIVNGKKVVKLLGTDVKVANNGYIRFKLDHGADYIFLPKTADNLANAQQITMLIENSIK